LLIQPLRLRRWILVKVCLCSVSARSHSARIRSLVAGGQREWGGSASTERPRRPRRVLGIGHRGEERRGSRESRVERGEGRESRGSRQSRVERLRVETLERQEVRRQENRSKRISGGLSRRAGARPEGERDPGSEPRGWCGGSLAGSLSSSGQAGGAGLADSPYRRRLQCVIPPWPSWPLS
jgi:hypothetical protein